MERTITLLAPDISCDHCKATIEGSLAREHGVRDVTVDVATHSVEVTYDAGVITLEAITSVLDDVGYPTAS